MSIRNTFKAASYLTVGLVLVRAFNFVQYALLARVLARQSVGDYAFSYSLALMLAGFSALGIAAAVIRQSAREAAREPELILTGIPLRLLTALLAMGVGLAIALILPWRAELRYTALLFSVTSVAISLARLNEHVLLLHGRARAATLCQVVMGAGQFGLVAAVLLTGGGVVAASACVMLAQVGLWLSTSHLVLQRLARPRPKPTWAACREILAIGWPVGLHGILNALYSGLDVMMLSGFRGNVEVAVYATALRLVNILVVLQQPANKALLPFLSREHKKDPDSLRKAHTTSIKLFTAVGLPGCVLGTLLLPLLIPAVYGAGYWESVLPAQVYIWSVPVRYITGLTVFALLAAGRQRVLPAGILAAALVKWGMNLVFIPRYGYLGSVVATTAGHVTMFFVFIYLSVRYVHRVRWMTAVAKPVLATAAMTAVALLLRGTGLAAQAGCAAMAYVAVLWMLRPFDAEEVRMFRKALGLKRRAP